MAHVIRNVRQFRKQLKVGDVFWQMTSWHYAPHEIQGPCTILGFFKHVGGGIPMVRHEWSRGEEQVIEEQSINDLTNEWHGVFLNAADAYAYFEECKAA